MFRQVGAIDRDDQPRQPGRGQRIDMPRSKPSIGDDRTGNPVLAVIETSRTTSGGGPGAHPLAASNIVFRGGAGSATLARMPPHRGNAPPRPMLVAGEAAKIARSIAYVGNRNVADGGQCQIPHSQSCTPMFVKIKSPPAFCADAPRPVLHRLFGEEGVKPRG
jgi:hypothetical protein